MIGPVRRAAERGFSLVEVLVAMIIFVVGVLGLASAATLGLAQLARARQDHQYYADLQQEMDSLGSLGWGKVKSGSTTIRGRTITWTVSTPGANSQLVTVIAQRRGYQNRNQLTRDSLVVYLVKPTLGL